MFLTSEFEGKPFTLTSMVMRKLEGIRTLATRLPATVLMAVVPMMLQETVQSKSNTVGVREGEVVGLAVGAQVGVRVGPLVGGLDGATDGAALGLAVGDLVGLNEGPAVGFAVGLTIGAAVGFGIGCVVGAAVGALDIVN